MYKDPRCRRVAARTGVAESGATIFNSGSWCEFPAVEVHVKLAYTTNDGKGFFAHLTVVLFSQINGS